jgi:uncharacterized protein YjbI with pentapeptide repeats
MWKKISKPLLVVVTFVASVLVIALIGGIIGGYVFNWGWAGLSQKTLWDWLQLLVIPLALAVIAILFNRSERKNEQRIASDNQQEAALQEYIKEMSEILLEKNLRKSEVDAEVRKIACIRTLTVLHRLDNSRKKNIVQFLYESGLIDKNEPIVNLRGANLNRVSLFGVSLDGTNLNGANLREANLGGASLYGTNLQGADLTRAILSMSRVNKVDLRRAYIPKATYFVLNPLGRAFLSGYFEGMVQRWSETNLQEANLGHALLAEADLRGTNLTRADLHSAFLVKANLQSAKLSGANLHGAILIEANLQGTNLQDSTLAGANLQGANLQDSILNDARLQIADLSKANLGKASLWRANLVRVFLVGADLSETDLSEADLSGAKVTQEQREKAKSLKDAIMPDGSIHP